MARKANSEANASEEDVRKQDMLIQKEIGKEGKEAVTPTENENPGAENVETTEESQIEENVETTESKIEEGSTEQEEKDTYISVRKKPWVDLQDNKYEYKQGDIYPREGLEVSEERIKELSTINNKLGEVLIQKVENKEE